MPQTVNKSKFTRDVSSDEELSVTPYVPDTMPIPYEGDTTQVLGLHMSTTATIEERLDLIDKLQTYMGVQCVKWADMDGKYFENKCPTAVIDVLGVVVKPKGELAVDGRFYTKGGEEQHAWVTLIKFRQEGDESPRILLFNSIAATNWAKLLMAAFGQMADFPYAIKFKISEIPAKVGHTYTFTRVKA